MQEDCMKLDYWCGLSYKIIFIKLEYTRFWAVTLVRVGSRPRSALQTDKPKERSVLTTSFVGTWYLKQTIYVMLQEETLLRKVGNILAIEKFAFANLVSSRL